MVASTVGNSTFNGIIATLNITAVDVPNSLFKAHVDLIPSGNFSRSTNDQLRRPSQPVSLFLGSKLVNFPADVPMAGQELIISMSNADTNDYPFDRFDANLIFTAFLNISDSKTAVRVGVRAQGALQGWTINPTLNEIVNTDGSFYVSIDLSAIRSITTKFFSVFIIIYMWFLSLSAIVLASTLWYRERKVEPPTIGFIASLLFALPAIRNTQPGVPSIGCTADTAGFMWNMFLVLVSVVLLMWNYIIKYTRVKTQPSLPDLTMPSKLA